MGLVCNFQEGSSVIHKCPQCQREFHFRTATRKYCSKRCKNKGLTVPLDTKQIYAEYDAGATMQEIAQKYNVSQTPVRLALIKEGYKAGTRPKKVMRLDTGEIFPSSTPAALAMGFSPSAISLAIRRGYKSGGSYWEYV